MMMLRKIYGLCILMAIAVTWGCMEDSGFEIVWEGKEVEFEAASLPNKTLTEVVFQDSQQPNQNDQVWLRINLVGAQITAPVELVMGIDTSSTAVQNVHFRLESTTITIPPNSSFVDFPVEILTDNLAPTELPDLTLNIIDAGDIKISANYGSVTLQIRVACPSDLAGTYRSVTVGTGGTLNSQVIITEIEPLTYRISDITGGLYSQIFREEDNPAIFTDLCNELTVFDQPDVVFGNDKFNGTGRVNPDGTITITWSNEKEDSGTTILTRIN